jgi:hypothetical protein
MSKSQLDSTGLLVGAAGSVLALLLQSSNGFEWLSSIAGLILLLGLLSYDREGYRTAMESLAFAGTVALSLTVALAAVMRVLDGSMAQPAPIAGRIGGEWMPAIWLFVTVVFWLVDRARMGARIPQAATPSTLQPTIFVPPSHPPAPPSQPAYTAAPPQPTYVPPPPPPVSTPAPSPAAPVFAPPPPVARPAFTQPTFSQPAAPEPAPPPPPIRQPPPPPPAPEPVYAAPPPPSPPPPVAPPPQAVPIPPGKEAMIYVTLVGEGLNVLRAVRAEHLGRDYYRIVEEMPEGETWQYGPGQVVKCKKKNLSSGKAMVAVEEAQRAG